MSSVKSRILKMAPRTYTQKDGTEWTWEETPETIEALKQLHETINQVNGRTETN
jgi:hypothetical protein